MELYKYKSYQEYKDIQVSTNKEKLHKVWADRDNIVFLSEYIRSKISKPTFGICHGTRRGLEQKWFSECLGCLVLGTEISDTANQFPNTVQMDFHETVPEWHNQADFVYTNSFDHACYPEKAFLAWFDSLKDTGMLILEHSSRHHPLAVCETDPFGATISELMELIPKWTLGVYSVTEILDAPVPRKGVGEIKFLITTMI